MPPQQSSTGPPRVELPPQRQMQSQSPLSAEVSLYWQESTIFQLGIAHPSAQYIHRGHYPLLQPRTVIDADDSPTVGRATAAHDKHIAAHSRRSATPTRTRFLKKRTHAPTFAKTCLSLWSSWMSRFHPSNFSYNFRRSIRIMIRNTPPEHCFFPLNHADDASRAASANDIGGQTGKHQ